MNKRRSFGKPEIVILIRVNRFHGIYTISFDEWNVYIKPYSN